jgi:hypothetical protein
MRRLLLELPETDCHSASNQNNDHWIDMFDTSIDADTGTLVVRAQPKKRCKYATEAEHLRQEMASLKQEHEITEMKLQAAIKEIDTLRTDNTHLAQAMTHFSKCTQALRPILEQFGKFGGIGDEQMDIPVKCDAADGGTNSNSQDYESFAVSAEIVEEGDEAEEEEAAVAELATFQMTKEEEAAIFRKECRQIGRHVDVKFTEGWYCGTVSALAGQKQVYVKFLDENDSVRRLLPKKGDIRACCHNPRTSNPSPL